MISKKIIAATVLILLLVSLSGCFALSTAGNGQMTDGSFLYDGAITSINVNGVPAAINVAPADSGEVTYTVDGNLKDLLKITYQDGVLGIATKNNRSITSNGIVFNVGAEALEAITVNGAAKIQGSGITARTFTLNINGAADVTLSGSVDTLDINSSGAAKVNTRDLIAGDVKVVLNGAGSIQVYAEKTLDASVNGIGSVTYWGDPTVAKSTQGLASVVKGS